MTTDIVSTVVKIEARRVSQCPYLRTDDAGYYCSKGMIEWDRIIETRRMVCDNYSLQLWCQDAENYVKCIEFDPGHAVLSKRQDQLPPASR